ncbi:exonuclease domain-containing protein [Streptomyces sp. NPDC002851]
MAAAPTTFVVFDLEFTTWPGALEQGWTAPGQLREIVQIGALRLSEDCAILEEYEALVRPIANPQLSDYFTQLTGIEQELVDREGADPAEALSELLGFCRGQTVLSYGNDMVVLGENLAWARARGDEIKGSFLDAAFLNIRPWLNTVAPETSEANVGRLWEVLALPKPMAGQGQGRGQRQEHSALFDCYSFADALRHLRARGDALPTGCT